MRLLVTGAAGMLGRATVDAATADGHDVIATDRDELDITDPVAVRDAIARDAPDAIVNCAAWTDVDGAEADEGGALILNAEAPGHLAHAATQEGTRLVHVSTDYVFDGSKRTPWVESDPVSPLNAYGRTKLAGEGRILAAGGDHAIVRTAWLYGAGGANFVETMLRLASEREEISVVTDQVGRPTWTGHLARALVDVAATPGLSGIVHAAGEGACSWHGFAEAIFARAGVDCRVCETTSDAFPRPATRPAYSVLGTEREPGVHLPPWEEGLDAYLRQRQGAAT